MFASLIFTVSSLTFAVIVAELVASSPLEEDANYCVLPPYPEHGRYTVSNNPSATPGERYSSVRLDISCDTGYLNNNTVKRILCVNGDWSASMPTCDRALQGFCTLPTDDLTVEYRCLWFPGTLEKSWECESLVPAGTPVRPICRFPAYFSFEILPEMHCRDEMWDYNPVCKPACGLTTQHRQLEGTSGNHLELPWHAVIYEKISGSYHRTCGGALISSTKIISSAQCFYNLNLHSKLLPAKIFMVAMNKMYHLYNESRDRNTQYSYVVDIKIPSSYQGFATYYEDDIAIAVIEKPLFFHLSVRPVCIDFGNNLDRTQLTEGNSGKTVHWSEAGNSDVSEAKNVIDFPYINIEDCSNIGINHRKFLRKDKFCAGYIGELNMCSKSRGTSKIVAAIVIFINVFIMMVCMFVFAVSLWVIASPSSLLNTVRVFGNLTVKSLITEESLCLQLGVAGALLAGFFFCIAFMGLYGAVTGSQFLLFMYSTLLVLLLLLEFSVTYYFTSNLVDKGIQIQDIQLNHLIRSSLQCCEHNYSAAVEVTPPWSCCGVDTYPNNCTIEKVYTLDCETAIIVWLSRYEMTFYISLTTLHIILLSCSLLRRYLSRPHT